MLKEDWIKLTEVMAPDEAERLTDQDREQALALAVIRFSTDRPRMEAADVVTLDGYTVPLPDGWQDGESRVAGIELPGGVPPVMIARDEWMPRRVPGADVILLVRPLRSGQPLRVHFTLPHVLDDEQDTIPAKDREAVAHWAAGLLLDTLSGKYAGDRQSTINADSVDHAAKMPNYKALAEAQRQAYWNHLGIDPKRTVASGAVVKIGNRRLLHNGPKDRRRS